MDADEIDDCVPSAPATGAALFAGATTMSAVTSASPTKPLVVPLALGASPVGLTPLRPRLQPLEVVWVDWARSP